MSAKLVPSCGGILWGYAGPDTSPGGLAAVESTMPSPFDFVYRFHDLDDTIPQPDEVSLVDEGRLLHVSIDSVIYSSDGHRLIRWHDVAAGAYDESLSAQAHGLAALDTPVFVTFEHEMDQGRKAALGTSADFRAAWRHVHSLFIEAGASNVVWVWVAMGWPETFATAGQMWPGNDVVDWISWDAYNTSGCRTGAIDATKSKSFADVVLPFLQWLKTNAARYGIDASKPMMISETGTVVHPERPSLATEWYQEMPAVLAAHPQIRAVTLWASVGVGTCDYRFTHVPEVSSSIAAVRESTKLRTGIRQ
ncbi:hypothetical protein ASG90_13070 [Nocardioides sp. Soil797]|nr:hypothetical protein ASG90_13070 [Nocardioides sp. Soil797]